MDSDHCKRNQQVHQVMQELMGGRVVFIGGASGAGKSRLLKGVERRCRKRMAWVDLGAIGIGRGLVVDVMAEEMGVDDSDAGVERALSALAQVGLGEVWTYLRPVAQLSEGQRWRLRLAIGLSRADRLASGGRLCVLAADEFAATLDRVTAMVVARNLRKTIGGRDKVCAIVASSHGDLAGALEADLRVRCDFGEVAYEREGGGAY